MSIAIIEPDVHDLELALRAIEAMDSRARPHPSMRSWCLLGPEGRKLYIILRDQKELPEDSIYVTWVVDIRDGGVTQTSYFLSTVKSDKTLPPISLSELEHL